MKNSIKKTICLLVLASPFTLLAHGGNTHENVETKTITKTVIGSKKVEYSSITAAYQTDIKPIFKAKCFDCHSTQTIYPWYYKIPGVKQMIEYDIKEAKKHLDMTQDFPFISHETPIKDLKSIAEEIEEDEMPPLKYLLGHWNARLTPSEKEKVATWTTQSIQILEGNKNEK
ncbi:heme-binding domain-containing protein [Sulfurimonas sp. SAG-AH-194-C21]|nr:heme-binding domain-containing protein [Sulfurimonas sp. SAG-AH-194-C21]MDF1883116.1 heme-binding domain-containing protein [Sulfurimonas sp. SAG-AH-194-C21]